MNKTRILLSAVASLAFVFTFGAYAEDIRHLPSAPSWNYRVKGEVLVAAVGSDYCDMDTGVTCDGANVLITGAPALILYNTMAQKDVNGIKTSAGIECSKDKCLFHVEKQGPAAGETPWISD